MREVSCVPQTGKAAGLGEGDQARADRSRQIVAEQDDDPVRIEAGERLGQARRIGRGAEPRRRGRRRRRVAHLLVEDVHRQRQEHRPARRGAGKRRRRAASAWPTSSPRRSSFAHLVTGSARATRSPESHGSVMRWRVSCWPAVTTSGVSLALEATSTPIALPKPPIACRLTKRGAARGERPAVGHADRRRLLQAEDVADVRRVDERVHERHLGRAGIAEDVSDPLVAQDVEQNVARASGHEVSLPLSSCAVHLGAARRRAPR